MLFRTHEFGKVLFNDWKSAFSIFSNHCPVGKDSAFSIFSNMYAERTYYIVSAQLLGPRYMLYMLCMYLVW